MNINTLLPLLTNICIYYYIRYYGEILRERVNISNNIHCNIMSKIYRQYVGITCDEYIYDIKVMDLPIEKVYILEKDDIDIKEIVDVIDKCIESYKHYYPIDNMNVLSISNHPIENYISFNHYWIKSSIDILLF